MHLVINKTLGFIKSVSWPSFKLTYPTGMSQMAQFVSQFVRRCARVYFSGSKDVNEFNLHLEEYILCSSIPDKNKYLLLKRSWKVEALLWFEHIRVFATDQAKINKQTVIE